MEPGRTRFLATGMPDIVQPVSSVSLPTDPQENQGEVAVNHSDGTTNEAAVNSSEDVLEIC